MSKAEITSGYSKPPAQMSSSTVTQSTTMEQPKEKIKYVNIGVQLENLNIGDGIPFVAGPSGAAGCRTSNPKKKETVTLNRASTQEVEAGISEPVCDEELDFSAVDDILNKAVGESQQPPVEIQRHFTTPQTPSHRSALEKWEDEADFAFMSESQFRPDMNCFNIDFEEVFNATVRCHYLVWLNLKYLGSYTEVFNWVPVIVRGTVSLILSSNFTLTT